MCTVPAQIFCAPTRAKLIAAARFMPGVWAVLASSESAGITRTPECFQPSAGAAKSSSAIREPPVVERPFWPGCATNARRGSAVGDPVFHLQHQIEPFLAEP